MPSLTVRVLDARRKPLDDLMDVQLTELQTSRLVGQKRGVRGSRAVTFTKLRGGLVYGVQVFPLRHRPVGVVQFAPDGDAPRVVDVFCPVVPGRFTAECPDYVELPAELRAVLERSLLEQEPSETDSGLAPGSTPGERLYHGLPTIAKAGLLNLFAKMRSTVSGGRTVWSFVGDVYRVRGDRIFANVALDFRDHIKTATVAKEFAKADSSLHRPPPGFEAADSFKHSQFHSGVLQLTYFAATAAPLRFRVDADIDDAGGIGHVFQVLRNFLTSGDTHPYDIHQILTFHQLIDPGYALVPA